MSGNRFDRRRFVRVAAASVAAGPGGLFGISEKLNAMTVELPDAAESAATGPDGVRPFRVNVPDADLADMHRRINATRWPEKELVSDDSQGVQLATMQKLARYWTTQHDWRKIEAKLNSY